jgi:hypothetical protein
MTATVQEYANRFSIIVNRLNRDEESKINWFKNGLSKEVYKGVLTFCTKVLQELIQEAKTLDAHLLHKSGKRTMAVKRVNAGKEKQPQMLTKKKSARQKHFGFHSENSLCFFCGAESHQLQECPKKDENFKKNGNKKPKELSAVFAATPYI